jgi:hypothetical protein
MAREMETELRAAPPATPSQVVAKATQLQETRSPFQGEIEKVARGFPNSFTPRSIQPVLREALKFAEERVTRVKAYRYGSILTPFGLPGGYTESWLNKIIHWSGSTSAESMQREAESARDGLLALARWSIADKSGQVFRNGIDREFEVVRQAVFRPYVNAAGFEGGKDPGPVASLARLGESFKEALKYDIPDMWEKAKPWLIFGGAVVGLAAAANIYGASRSHRPRAQAQASRI